MFPLVSIVTVCFNAKYDLEKTVESVINQDFRDFEYVIIDGGSTDGTFELLNNLEYRFKCKSIKFKYVSEVDKGTYDAMNKSLNFINGVWVNYLNAGDVFASNSTLSDFWKCSIKEDISVCYGNTIEEYAFGQGLIQYDEEYHKNAVMPFCHQSAFVRKEIMRRYKFDIRYKIIADHDLFYRLRKDGLKFIHIPIIVSVYNAQYGLSATNPLLLNLELLKVYHVDKKWYYFFVLVYTYIRQGLVQPLKRYMPRYLVYQLMMKRRKYIN